jgi:glutamyl/glutaminyl-tRNA synthetase
LVRFPLVTRFAPAPTGNLHLGHIVNAIYVWGVARACDPEGRVLLRIEDHDRHRSRPVFESAILEDLGWLGFVADEPLIRQSDRSALYERALDQLRVRGLVYACGCSRSEIAADVTNVGDGLQAVPPELRYPGTCTDKGLPEAPGLGLRVRLEPAVERFDDWLHGPQEQRPHEQCGDLLVRDRDGNWTYQFAAVVDDYLQGVTLVIRGDDLLASTGRQIQLARLLGRADPPSFLHHPLVMKNPTQKLSKSDGDTGIRDLRAKGWSAERVIGQAAALAGLIDVARPMRAEDASDVVGRVLSTRRNPRIPG